MKIGLGADHGGYKLKQLIKEHLEKNGYEVVDYGTNSSDSVDYPDYGKKVAQAVIDNEVEKGIGCCGRGRGIGGAASKVKDIRVLGAGLALEIVDAFLNTEFEGDRHQRRVDKIMDIEGGFTCQN